MAVRIPTLGSARPAVATTKRYTGPRDPSFWLSGFRKALTYTGLPNESPVKYNVWVYRALKTIADNLAQVPFVMRRGSSEEHNRSLVKMPHQRLDRVRGAQAQGAREIGAGPWFDLFENPNPLITGPELWQFTAFQMSDIPGGSSYWVLESGEERELGPTEIPSEIWPMPKGVMQQVFAEDGRRLIGYIVTSFNYRTARTEKMAIPAHNVIHHRYIDPNDPAGSMSPLESAFSGIKQDFQASEWNEAFFRNDATPGILLTTTDSLDPDQREANRKEWESLHGGTTRSHRAAILEGGLTAQVVGSSHTEMGFRQLREWNREEVAAATGVPKWYFGVTNDINYATSKSAERILWTAVLMPLARMLARNLDFQLFRARDPIETSREWRDKIPALGSAEVWGEFDTTTVEALRQDLNEKLDSAAKLRALSYPMNEVNEVLEMGMDPQKGGDVALVQGGWMVLEDVVSGIDFNALIDEVNEAEAEEAAEELLDPALGIPFEEVSKDGVGGGDNEGAEIADGNDRPRAWDPKSDTVYKMERLTSDSAAHMDSVYLSDIVRAALDNYEDGELGYCIGRLERALEQTINIEDQARRQDYVNRLEELRRDVRREKQAIETIGEWTSDTLRKYGGLPGASKDRGNEKRREQIWRSMVRRVLDPAEKKMLVVLVRLFKKIRKDSLNVIEEVKRTHASAVERAVAGTVDFVEIDSKTITVFKDDEIVGKMKKDRGGWTITLNDKVLPRRPRLLEDAKDLARERLGTPTAAEILDSEADLTDRLKDLDDRWRIEMSRLGDPVVNDAAFAGLNELDSQLPEFVTVDAQNPEVVLAIAEAKRKLQDVPDGVAKYMRLSLAKGYAEGETLEELGDRVRQSIQTAGNYAPRIARDEISQAVNATRRASMETLDHVAGSEWISSRDGKVRETHVRLDGQVRPADGRYPNVSGLPGGALRYPQDPEGPDSEVKGCRCVEAPVLEF